VQVPLAQLNRLLITSYLIPLNDNGRCRRVLMTRKLKVGDEEKVESFLSKFAEYTMFMRSNLLRAGFEFNDEIYQGDYLGSFNQEGDIIGILAHYWNGNIMMQAQDDEVLDTLVCQFKKNAHRPVAGIIGEHNQVMSVIHKLDLMEAPYSLNRKEGLYYLSLKSLCQPKMLASSSYELIEASKLKRDILSEWITGYQIEAFGAVNDEKLPQRVKEQVEGLVRGDCWVLKVDDKAVSLSGFNATLPEIVQIGPVWTPKRYRCLGYARTLIALVLQSAMKRGVKKAILFTDNPPAAKAYEAIGFNKIGSYHLALLKSPMKL